MELTQMEMENLFHENFKLIGATIHRQFPLSGSFLKVHGLTMDDLIQYGRIGLWNAIRTYDKTKGSAFRSYIIQNIVWTINTEVRRDSLANLRNETLVVAPVVSAETVLAESDGESVRLIDTIESEELGFDDAELIFMIDKLDGDLREVIKLRLKDYTYNEIGRKLNVSKQYAQRIVKENQRQIRRLCT